jgi:HEPN domain-containing protein
MGDRKAELTAAWLLKAQHDLETARLLIQKEKRLLDMAVFHCQQAGEKAFKGYLNQQDIVFPKTHSLVQLLNLIIPVARDFGRFMEHAKALTPLAHEFRYPGDVPAPTPAEAANALRMAEEIYSFCEQRLPGASP